MPDLDPIEVAARAMAESDRRDWDRKGVGPLPSPTWDQMNQEGRSQYMRLARVAAEALTDTTTHTLV